jgi:hypothetical protein
MTEAVLGLWVGFTLAALVYVARTLPPPSAGQPAIMLADRGLDQGLALSN